MFGNDFIELAKVLLGIDCAEFCCLGNAYNSWFGVMYIRPFGDQFFDIEWIKFAIFAFTE